MLGGAENVLPAIGEQLGPFAERALRKRLEQGRTDRDMVARLEEAMIRRVNVRGREAADRAFREAYTAYGIDVADADSCTSWRARARCALRFCAFIRPPTIDS